MINYSDLSVKYEDGYNRLFHGKKDTGIKLRYDFQTYLGRDDSFRIVYSDEVESDIFNYTRACDNAKKYYLSVANRIPEIATEKLTG